MLVTIIFTVFVTTFSVAELLEVGDNCSGDEQCGNLMICHKGQCTCSPKANMIPVFKNGILQTGILCLEKEKCDYRTRTHGNLKLCEVGVCILEPGEYHGFCSCAEGEMMTVNSINNSTCWPFERKSFNKICHDRSPMCDERKGLTCYRHCLCKPGHIYNFTKEECISDKQFLEEFDLKEYKGRWGDYCVTDDMCLELLECATNRTCSCPIDCYGYIEEHNSCYCGDWEFPTGPVIVGSICSFFIIYFWCYQIKKLRKKFMEKVHRTSRPSYEAASQNGDSSQDDEDSSPADDKDFDYESTTAAGSSSDMTEVHLKKRKPPASK